MNRTLAIIFTGCIQNTESGFSRLFSRVVASMFAAVINIITIIMTIIWPSQFRLCDCAVVSATDTLHNGRLTDTHTPLLLTLWLVHVNLCTLYSGLNTVCRLHYWPAPSHKQPRYRLSRSGSATSLQVQSDWLQALKRNTLAPLFIQQLWLH